MNKFKIVCITPVKNEEWILDNFLKCTSLWADKIIIADQNSDDNSIGIAKKYNKVVLVKNNNPKFNEPERQKILINNARKIKGKKIIIALDADEAFTADAVKSNEWKKLYNLEPGTVIYFKWANILHGCDKYWLALDNMPFGFVDDGSLHKGSPIHSPRIPLSEKSNKYYSKLIVMHMQYTNIKRMKSKHRWYQCWERLNNLERSAVDIYRQYHHMDSVPKKMIGIVPNNWFDDYTRKGIDFKVKMHNTSNYWDKLVLDMINDNGVDAFRKEQIWDFDWIEKAKEYKYRKLDNFKDPRTYYEKFIHIWLKITQPYFKNHFVNIVDKLIMKYLKF